jgi:hypothetical protein
MVLHAPATISDAEADPPLINTMTGLAVGQIARPGVEALGLLSIAAAGWTRSLPCLGTHPTLKIA